MWISEKYYNELLKTLKQFSRGQYNFDDEILMQFNDTKYQKINYILEDIKVNSNNNIKQAVDIINSFIYGNYSSIDIEKHHFGDYNIFYDKCLLLSRQFEKMDRGIKCFEKSILKNGKIDSKISADALYGKWFDMIVSLNTILEYFEQYLNEIIIVINNVATGNLHQKMRLYIDNFDIKGDFFNLANTINTMIDQLLKFSLEVTRVAREVGTEGLLGGQARVEGVSGTWLDLTNNVNLMANSLTKQVRNIADVTTAVAKGDLSQKITVEARGEVLELKQTVNIMVDQLSQFASEITRVAQEVGEEGRLGVQARVEDVSGIWLGLTNNINNMSHSLAEVDIKNKSQNWIKDGISILSKEIMNQDGLTNQIDKAINQLSRYINAGIGVIYLYDATEELLTLEASYAYAASDKLPLTFKIGEGIIGQVARDKKPIFLNSVSGTLFIHSATVKQESFNTYTSPILFENKLVGVAELASYEPFTPLTLEYLESAITMLAGSFYASLQMRDKKRLEEISIKDALTGLFNRGHFNTILSKCINQSKRQDGIVNFAILDIDYFKNFNDEYGHQTGDEVLKRVANVLQSKANRKNDYCFRIGGEEFAIVFSADSKEKAFNFMLMIKNAIEDLEIRDTSNHLINNITISIGLTSQRASDIENLKVLFEQTDKLLYLAKKNGRNRIVQND